MNAETRLKRRLGLQLALFLIGPVLIYGADPDSINNVTAVSAHVSSDYVHQKNRDGVYQVEYYSFGDGGFRRGNAKDSSIDDMPFLDVARIMAGPLASKNYLPAKDPKTTKLLIMLYWGQTDGAEHASESASYDKLKDATASAAQAMTDLKQASVSGAQKGGVASLMYMRSMQGQFESAEGQADAANASVQIENNLRDQADYANVRLLGYDSWWDATSNDAKGTPLALERQDLINEIELNHYFVVLMAYDFQLLWKDKKHKLLWEARFSIRQRNHQFNNDLAAIAQYASQFFGEDSGGLVRKEIPVGHVEIGTLKTVDENEAPKK
jgi:hypothetical protein